MEQRIAKLEVHVEHIVSALSDMKVDMREMRKDLAATKDSIASFALATEEKLSRLTRWVVALGIVLCGGMATGFLWLADKIRP